MSKLVVVINGSGGVGKDTLCDIAAKHFKVVNVSSIDPIKKIASENGWNGEKNEKTRKFLADLKELFVEFNDLPCNYLVSIYEEFIQSDNEVLFMHIREPKEIKKIVERLGNGCVTLLIRGRDDSVVAWKNAADDEVEQYEYDYYYRNNKPLENVEEDFIPFFKEVFEKSSL